MPRDIDFAKLTLQDALDLAILIEEEAEERYREFNEMLGERYEGDAASLFTMMSENEAKHRRELGVLRASLFKDAARRVSRSMISDVEAPEYGKPRQYMSPRQAMELALQSEVKAYSFFDEALKVVRDPQVKILFEELRREEVEHQQLIREFMKKMPADSGADKTEADLDEPQGLD